jgi:hypothetical protein
MTKKAGTNKDPIMNEAERVSLIIDKYIRNENDRVEMKKTLTPLIIQFLLRWDNDKEVVMEDRIIEIVMKKMKEIYEKDNAMICKSVVNEVSKTLAEALTPFYNQMEAIAKDIKDIKEDVLNICDRLQVIETKQLSDEDTLSEIVMRLDKKKVRLDEIERKVELLQPEPIQNLVKEVHSLRPTLLRLIKTQVWWNIALRIFIAVAISAIITLLIHYNVPHKMKLDPNQRIEIITE